MTKSLSTCLDMIEHSTAQEACMWSRGHRRAWVKRKAPCEYDGKKGASGKLSQR